MTSRSLPVVLCIAASLAGCVVDVDWDGARLACSDGQCPSGFECVAERCVPEGTGPVESDAAVDEPAIDAEPPVRVADAAPPDATSTLACDTQYGAAPSYQLCEQTAESCQFFLNTRAPATCDEICAALGGFCLTEHNADVGAECVLQAEDGCAALHQSQVCTCSLGPGNI